MLAFFGGLANENIAKSITPENLDTIEREAEAAVASLLLALRIDYSRDHNTQDTPGRVARMLVREVFAGRYQAPPRITDFPNVKKLDELYTVGPIAVRSCCAHHLCPIEGEAYVGVIPGERIIGLSKFSRLTEWVMARPQIQEEATVQLADEIERLIEPRGLGVIVSARHSCMTWRGVREPNSRMVTSVMRGLFRENDAARSELLALAKGGG
jgi:GTP cyclohydrolase I